MRLNQTWDLLFTLPLEPLHYYCSYKNNVSTSTTTSTRYYQLVPFNCPLLYCDANIFHLTILNTVLAQNGRLFLDPLLLCPARQKCPAEACLAGHSNSLYHYLAYITCSALQRMLFVRIILIKICEWLI